MRRYRTADEEARLRCRVVAFLDTAYFDGVKRAKPRHANPSLELVAEIDGRIIGLIDVERETEAGTICSPRAGLAAWTRDDEWVRAWYESVGFARFSPYLHVCLGEQELGGAITSQMRGLRPVSVFAHYAGDELLLG